jgi:hypothetical protein
MLGFDSWEEARQRRGIHYVFPEDRQFVNEVLWPTVLEKGSWSREMRFRHFKTGDPIPILYSCFRIDDPQTGQPVNVAPPFNLRFLAMQPFHRSRKLCLVGPPIDDFLAHSRFGRSAYGHCVRRRFSTPVTPGIGQLFRALALMPPS